MPDETGSVAPTPPNSPAPPTLPRAPRGSPPHPTVAGLPERWEPARLVDAVDLEAWKANRAPGQVPLERLVARTQERVRDALAGWEPQGTDRDAIYAAAFAGSSAPRRPDAGRELVAVLAVLARGAGPRQRSARIAAGAVRFLWTFDEALLSRERGSPFVAPRPGSTFALLDATLRETAADRTELRKVRAFARAALRQLAVSRVIDWRTIDRREERVLEAIDRVDEAVVQAARRAEESRAEEARARAEREQAERDAAERARAVREEAARNAAALAGVTRAAVREELARISRDKVGEGGDATRQSAVAVSSPLTVYVRAREVLEARGRGDASKRKIHGYVDSPERPLNGGGGITIGVLRALRELSREGSLRAETKSRRSLMQRVKGITADWGISLTESGPVWKCAPFRIEYLVDQAKDVEAMKREVETILRAPDFDA